jgi:hypothetical protein
LNELITTVTYRTVDAVDKLNYKNLTLDFVNDNESVRFERLSDDFRLVTTLLIKSFVSTHTSIIQILRLGNEKNETTKHKIMNYGSDAMSLVREQIEKVFLVSLLCDNPIKWIEVYMKDEWKRAYEYQLNCKAENQNLPRFADFYENEFSDHFEKGKKIFCISEKEKEAVEFKFNNPNTELPPHLKDYLIKQFPTPGAAKEKISDQKAKEFLERWHWEYKFYCGFNHAGFTKIRFSLMSDRRFSSWFKQSKKEEIYEDKIIFTSLWVSYVAFASATTELLKFVSHDLEVNVALIELWKILQERSLIAKTIWNVRAKHFFPLI